MKDIFIDGRMYHHTGIGRFLRNRLQQMEEHDKVSSGTLILPPGTDYSSSRFHTIHSSIPIYSLREQKLLSHLSRQYHASLYFSPHYILPFKGRNSTSYIATIHDLSHFQYGGLKKQAARWYIHNALKKTRHLITVSISVKKQLEVLYPEYKGEIITIPNGIEESFFQQPTLSEIQYIRMKYKLPDTFWLTSGGQKPHKNLALLKKMRRFLPPETAPTLIVVLGNYGLKNPVEEENFLYLPYISDNEIPLVYRAAELFLFPSKAEGFGLPILEAFACGVPVICSDIEVHRENYAGGALFFSPENAREAAQQVKKALHSMSLKNRLTSRALSIAQRHSWKETSETFMGVLQKAYENRHHN